MQEQFLWRPATQRWWMKRRRYYAPSPLFLVLTFVFVFISAEVQELRFLCTSSLHQRSRKIWDSKEASWPYIQRSQWHSFSSSMVCENWIYSSWTNLPWWNLQILTRTRPLLAKFVGTDVCKECKVSRRCHIHFLCMLPCPSSVFCLESHHQWPLTSSSTRRSF